MLARPRPLERMASRSLSVREWLRVSTVANSSWCPAPATCRRSADGGVIDVVEAVGRVVPAALSTRMGLLREAARAAERKCLASCSLSM